MSDMASARPAFMFLATLTTFHTSSMMKVISQNAMNNSKLEVRGA
jgi:hypothetical protein